jgi:hypothetical protein
MKLSDETTAEFLSWVKSNCSADGLDESGELLRPDFWIEDLWRQSAATPGVYHLPKDAWRTDYPPLGFSYEYEEDEEE